MAWMQGRGGIWTRDPVVIELISHFDAPGRKGNWEKITAKEGKIIMAELDRCRQDFSYAARNYFWIVDKAGQDIPFRLWESQELILEKWYWLRDKFPNRAQKMMLLKARQLGASTVIEGLIAWATIFFSNRNGLVVSHNDSHAAYLYSIMLHIYDMLPWWLKPMCASRKQEQGLFLANPDLDGRRENPGNNSLISVQSASQLSGVGQGMKLNAVHCSEYADWTWDKFKDIIDGDMVHAIADNINSFAFLESTGKGSGSPSEEMWVAQNELIEKGEEAEWLPVFLPWFFESTRVMAPEDGWHIQQPENDMREKIFRDWVKCDNQECGQFFESQFRHMSRIDVPCQECTLGTLRCVILSDDQLRFMQNRRMNAEHKGPDSVKRLREELATTAEEAFQLTGIQVFPPSCQEFVNMCVDRNPKIWGNIDKLGRLHYVKDPVYPDFNPADPEHPCGVEGCLENHRWDPEKPLQIWEEVDPNALYCIGADVAEGLSGKADYSVAFVNKYYENGRGPDEQVAMWRSNTVDPIAFAGVLNAMGRYYNTALIAVEINKYDSCDMALRMHHMYPNPFVWKHYDSKNPISQKLGWFTNQRTKSMLWQTGVRWIKARMWAIKSDVFAQEMKRFQKDDYDSTSAGAERNFHDDVIIAGLIALFCLAPETRVLTSDLRWIPIGECQVGDALIGFDEDINCLRGSHCLLREAKITSLKIIDEPRYEIVTDKGSVISSGHHGWATVKYKAHAAQQRRWVTTENLKSGDRIIEFTRPWEADNRPESQWLAGFLDGEGCVRTGHKGLLGSGRDVGRGRVTFAQNPGTALNKAVRVCKELGFNPKLKSGNMVYKGNPAKCQVVELSVPSNYSALEIIGRLRPVRLLENIRPLWFERPFMGWHYPLGSATVIEIRPLGIGPVVSVGTTTKTLFAEGLASHNCAHDMDYGDNLDYIPVKDTTAMVQSGELVNTCSRCHKSWNTEDQPSRKCPYCRCMLVSSYRNTSVAPRSQFDITELGKTREEVDEERGERVRTEFDPEDSFATI